MPEANNCLIGHTGFVGGNLLRQTTFRHCFNSSNISCIRGQEYDLIVCGGVSAVKWWANKNPAEDLARINALLENLATARAAEVVVLSTVDVYPQVQGVDESFACHSAQNHAYGANRLYFEDAVSRLFNTKLIRISGVFGPGLKKNVIYDLLHDNCLDAINPESRFQYYNVARLWRDIETIREAGLSLVNFVTEPVATSEIIARLFPGKQVGASCGPAVSYDVRTRHSDLFSASPHYLRHARQVMDELEAFVAAERAGGAS